jgi:hypothetical protein
MGKTLKPGSLCKLGKGDVKKHFDELVEITKKSRYLCAKCARSAGDRRRLCKPLEM